MVILVGLERLFGSSWVISSFGVTLTFCDKSFTVEMGREITRSMD